MKPAAGLPNAAQMSTPAIARGQLVDKGGAAISHGLVLLYAQPASGPGVADAATTRPIAQAMTDASGHWALKVPSGTDLSGKVLSGVVEPSVNFMAVAWSTRGASQYFFSVPVSATPSSGTAARASAATGVTVGGKTMVLDGSQSSASRGVRMTANTPVHRGMPAGTNARAATSKIGSESCNSHVQRVFHGRNAKVGSRHSKTSNATVDFTYARGSTSHLGVGYSYSGKYGSFHGDGAWELGSSATQDYTPLRGKGSTNYITKVTYKKIHHLCYEIGADLYSQSTTLVPTGIEGGTYYQRAGGVSYGHCRKLSRGAHMTVNHNKAFTYGAGVSLLGFSAEARSGWNSATSEKVSASRNIKLCGLGAYPIQAPKALQAKPL